MSQILLKLYSWLNKSDSRYASSNFVNHSYDYRPIANWTPLSPVTITNLYYLCIKRRLKSSSKFTCTSNLILREINVIPLSFGHLSFLHFLSQPSSWRACIIYLKRLLVRLFIYLFIFLNIVILPGNFTGF